MIVVLKRSKVVYRLFGGLQEVIGFRYFYDELFRRGITTLKIHGGSGANRDVCQLIHLVRHVPVSML